MIQQLKPLPTNTLQLLEPINLQEEDTYICLTDESLETFHDLYKEWNNKELFAKHKLPIRNKILLHGPTGNGKTTVAKFLARKAGLEMYAVKHEQLIDSHIGTTGKNIAQLFDTVQDRCLLFFDEIDSVSMSRGSHDSAAGEEYNKALNVLLIKMERMSPEVIFVGATNRKDLMDTAFIRRFDLVHEMPLPDLKHKISFMERIVKFYDITIGEEVKDIIELESFNDIKKALINHLRKQLLKEIAK